MFKWISKKRVIKENKKFTKIIDAALNEIDVLTYEATEDKAKIFLSDFERGVVLACNRINRRMQEALESEEE